MDLSLEQVVARLTRAEQDQLLADLDDAALSGLPYDWYGWAGRPSQQVPVTGSDSEFAVMLLLGGRGSGKSRGGAEWVRELDARWGALGRTLLPGERLRVALLGRTAADVRDTMLQGPSGLLNIYPPSMADRVVHTPTNRRVDLPGGGVVTTFSAEEPDQLRGPAFHVGWADELGTFRAKPGVDGLTAWDNLRISVRMGTRPQVLATTTPKRTPILRALLAEARESASVQVRNMRTVDNPFLPDTYLAVLLGLYEGTSLGRQELDGLLLDDVEGALLPQSTIDAHRVDWLPEYLTPGRRLAVVGVDPSVAERPQDECGIVVAVSTGGYPVLSREAYVVDDRSGRMGPSAWGQTVVEAARDWDATVIVEVNQGGSLVKRVIAEAAARLGIPAPKVREVHAKQGKALRAEPVQAAYQRGRVHHVNTLADLEAQWTAWLPGESGYSPDRLDAAVYAIAALLLPDYVKGGFGPVSTASPARRQVQWGNPAGTHRGGLYGNRRIPL